MITRRTLALAVALAAAPAAASAQFANMDLNAMNNAFNARMNGQMAQQQNNITRQVLSDPRAMALYPTCGRGLTREQFAYKYAATAGCTAQGARAYMNNEANNSARVQRSWQGYQGAVQNYREAYGGWTAAQSANMQEAGRGLMGNGTYYDPAAGRNVELRYIQPGQTYRDSASGRTYAMDPNGRYWSTTGNGAWTPVNPAVRSPR